MSDAPPGRVHRRAHFPRLLGGGSDAPPSLARSRTRRAAHSRLRVSTWRWLAGWFLIVLGLLGVVLPLVPALVLLPIGVALVGRRSTVVRWSRTRMKLLLRVAETWHGLPGRLGRFLRERERRMASFLRERRIGKWERPRRA
jgi:hypothetical protein